MSSKEARRIAKIRHGEEEMNMKQELRWREFSGPIMDLSLHSPIIHDVMSAYAAGRIVTKEEALSQMVVRLANNLTIGERQALEWAATYQAIPAAKLAAS